MAVQLAYERGLPAALIMGPDGTPVGLLAQTSEEMLRCDWKGDSMTRMTLNDWRESAPPIKTLRVYFPFSACQLRNQVLARALATYTPEHAELPDMIPTFTVAFQFHSWTGRPPSFDELAALYSDVEIEQIKKAMVLVGPSTDSPVESSP
jgi:hypothetical protein